MAGPVRPDMPRSDYDAIIVGAGHNGLICAAYLARAGYRVAVFERRRSVGGSVVTEEIVPGFRFDLGGSAHSFIRLTPILEDLHLADYGLDYIRLDPMFWLPFPDNTSLTMWESIEATAESIAQFSPADAAQYRNLCRQWTPVALALRDMMLTRPAILRLGRAFLHGLSERRGWHITQFLDLRRSMRQFLDAYFENEKTKALLGWSAAQGGLAPNAPGSAFVLFWDMLFHQCGIHIPRGGSGGLTRALARMIEAQGGAIHTGGAVRRIVVDNGRAGGIELADGTAVTGKLIIAATHIAQTVRFLGDALPGGMVRHLQGLKSTNGLGLALRLATNALPDYLAAPGQSGPQHTAIQMICPSLTYLDAAWAAYSRNEISPNPMMCVMGFSALDGTLAPPGKHVLSIWAQYFPYQLAGGQDWNQLGDVAADSILSTLATYAPNIRESVIDRLVETPLYLEQELGLTGGDLQHIQQSPGQMFMLRPSWRLSQYNTPIAGLYLTGASTHPGGGIMGMSGYNTAHAILEDHVLD